MASPTIDYVRFGIEVLTIIFVVYLYFRKPQIAADQEIRDHYQSFQAAQDKNMIFFKQMERDLTNMRENHIHTLEVKQDQQAEQIGQIKVDIARGMARIETLMEERFPKK